MTENDNKEKGREKEREETSRLLLFGVYSVSV